VNVMGQTLQIFFRRTLQENFIHGSWGLFRRDNLPADDI
jgi:hypothetical protein